LGEAKFMKHTEDKEMENTWKELFHQLEMEGGAIVCSNECHVIELADARLHGRMFVNDDGIGFVRRPKAWLDNVKQALTEKNYE
jgi:hypothetical protein